jgi:sugar O-acyltransferase (sialic acid O-acetyltransferase NeuD family)
LSRLLIIGAGGHGAVVAEAAAAQGCWDEIAFLDDDLSINKVIEFPVLGKPNEISRFSDKHTSAIVAVGDNRRRLRFMEEISRQGTSLASVVHPAAVISPSVKIAAGTVAFAAVVINARARIGSGCILNTGATVDHDCVLGAGVHVSPGANLAGGVTVGDCAWVGIGAAVKEGICIGADAVVGAGAAVVSDIDDGDIVAGVPARTLKQEK